jgi:MurNAc alpha-1-phosphate uridylyltransferase
VNTRAPVKAMVLAAGRGARMRDLTDRLPKPLIPVGGKPLIERHLESLRRAGVTDVVINLGWLGEKIRETIGGGSRYGVRVQYSEEGWPALEVGGGIFHALPLLGAGPFIVVNADVYSDYPLAQLVERARTLADGTLSHLVVVPNPAYYPQGDFSLVNGRVLNEGPGRCTFSGMSVHRPEFFAGCTGGHFPMLPLWRKAAERHEIAGEMHEGRWSDVGTPERLAELERTLAAGRAEAT